MGEQSSQNKVRLLYIEDDKNISKIVLKYLMENKHTNFIVTLKHTLVEALDYLNKNCFDENNIPNINVILLDLMLSNSKGISTYEKLAASSRNIPIVITSSFEDIAIECVKRGAQDYISKPIYGLDTVTKSLRYAIERAKLTEEKIAAEKGYSRVIELTPLGIHIYKLKDDGRLILSSYNDSSNKILNFDHKIILNKDIEEAFPGLKNTEVPKIYKDIAKNGGTFCEVREYKDSRIPRSYYRMNVFQSTDNEVTVMFENITKSVLTEKKFKDLVEATNAGIFEVDYKINRVIYANDKACSIIGYSKEEILNLEFSKILTKESLNKFYEKMSDLDSGKFIDKTMEYDILTKSGNIKNILCTFEYIEDSTKKVIGATGVALDITEYKKTKEKLKQQEEKIFNELENRLHQWRSELFLSPYVQNSLGTQGL